MPAFSRPSTARLGAFLVSGWDFCFGLGFLVEGFRVVANNHPRTYTTNFIDLTPVKNIYLHCNEISNYNQLTVAGNSSIVKKVPVNVPYLGIINDNELSAEDYIDVSGKMLRRLNIRLSDHRNNTINLNGVDISFTLTFFRG